MQLISIFPPITTIAQKWGEALTAHCFCLFTVLTFIVLKTKKLFLYYFFSGLGFYLVSAVIFVP